MWSGEAEFLLSSWDHPDLSIRMQWEMFLVASGRLSPKPCAASMCFPKPPSPGVLKTLFVFGQNPHAVSAGFRKALDLAKTRSEAFRGLVTKKCYVSSRSLGFVTSGASATQNVIARPCSEASLVYFHVTYFQDSVYRIAASVGSEGIRIHSKYTHRRLETLKIPYKAL